MNEETNLKEMMSGKHTLKAVFIVACLLISCFILTGMQVEEKHEQKKVESLKEAFQGKFLIGTALNAWQLLGRRPAEMNLVKKNFNSIVAENCMKSGRLQPQEGNFDFRLADKFVLFGEKNKMKIHGHTLIWHSQTPNWFFTNNTGEEISKEILIQRMKTHIETVMGRYQGKIQSWDVVNEAFEDDGSYRQSKFYKILGKDFIKLAFQFAHEADPEAKLYYNDYSMFKPAKRKAVVNMVKELKTEGIAVDGIGMQSHVEMSRPELSEFENSIEAFGALGEVAISELDLSVLPSPWGDAGAEVSRNFEYEDKMNPFSKGLPQQVSESFTERYLQFFKLFLKHQDKISRVTLWGVTDGNSWKNNWPVKGRTDYPLFFNRNNQPKPVVDSVIKLVKNKYSK